MSEKTYGDSENQGEPFERDLRGQRREYISQPFHRAQLADCPVQQFSQWFELAQQYHTVDVSSMQLATASRTGMPSVRTVLLKHFDPQGFCWYSNSGSEKASQLTDNPVAQLHFYWFKLNRQVRISGSVERLGQEEVEEYFHSRPFGSQVSAVASRQSTVVANRAVLEKAVEELAGYFQSMPIPCPADWCGYRLKPNRFEFWQGQESRLHDRLVYIREGVAESAMAWRVERLAP